MSSAGIVLLCLLFILACNASPASDDSVGPTKIRFYTGNLSVGNFMEYWGTGKPGPGDVATPEYCAQMKSVSVVASCDYLAWCLIEKEPGKWDWSIYDRNEQVLHANGLAYNVFCWLHFPPRWFMDTPEYVPYRCVEHDEPVQMTSLWAPGTLRIYERFYKQLAEHFGDRIDFVRLAAPAEYGEIGYPSGMTNWLVKQEHVHPGFWCNDPFARQSFRATMKKRYGSISRLNQTWGTSFSSFDAIEFPPVARSRDGLKDPLQMTPAERKWMLDFIGWYYDSQAEFMRKAVGIVRKCFPGKEIIVSMGYGSQKTVYGNDDVGIARFCRDMKVACQTPGNIPYFCMKSLSSPCHFYGVPYFTEPPGGMSRNDEVARIFSDACCGTQTYFDYPGNLLGARDIFARYKDYLDGKQAIVDIAVFFPTTDHRLRSQDWPANTIGGANHLRETLDYDLVDERMIRDGALNKYRLLIALDGNIVQAKTLSVLEEWLRKGGVMLVRDFGPVETVDGDRSFYSRFFPRTDGLKAGVSVPELLKSSSRKVGKGAVIMVSRDEDFRGFALLTSDLAWNLSKYFPGKTDVPRIDAEPDSVSASLFSDRILYYTWSDTPVEKTIELREGDFPRKGRTGRPERFSWKLKMEPHSITSIPLAADR